MKDRIAPLLRQSIVYSLGGVTGSLIGIVMVPLYTRVFSADEYGVLNLVKVTVMFLGVLLVLGMDNASGRYYLDTTDKRDRRVTASTVLIFQTLVLSTGCLLFVLFSTDISRLIFGDGTYGRYLIIAAAAMPFSVLAALCQALLRYNFRSSVYAVVAVAHVLVTVSLTLLFVMVLGWGIGGVFAATLISSVVLLFVNFFITRGYFSLAFSTIRLKELLQYGVPLVPYGITIYLLQNGDRYFLSYFSTLEEVGLYSLGVQGANVLTLLFTGIALAWGPFVLSTYKEVNIGAVYCRVMGYIVSAVLLMVIGLTLFSREALMVFTTPPYYGAYVVVPFLALYVGFFHLGLIMSFGIIIAKKTLHFTWISAAATAVNVGLNFLLVPRYGMTGAALATLACSIVWVTLLVAISQKYYRVDYRVASFLGILGVAIAIMAIGYLLLADLNLRNMLMKLALVGVFLASVYLFRLVGRDELRYLRELVLSRMPRRWR